MPRRIRKAPEYIRPSMGLKGWQDAIKSGLVSPETVGTAYAGAPRFVRQAYHLGRRAAPGAPTMGAPELSQQFWGGFRTPAEQAAEKQFVAGAERDIATSRAGAEIAPDIAATGLRERTLPLDIQEQRAEQELKMGAPTLEAASIANQLAQQQLEEQKATAPERERQLGYGPPLTEAEALGALPEQLRIAPAMEKFGMEGMGAPAVADVQRQQALGQAGNIMAMTGLDRMIGLIDPEQNLMADIAGDALQPNEDTPRKMQTFVSALQDALSQATSEERTFIISQIRANPNYTDLLKWTEGRMGGYLRGRWSLMSNKRYMEMNRLAQELQQLVEGQ